jgi:hypothetical protein
MRKITVTERNGSAAMTITLELTPEIEARVQAQAAARGLPVRTYLQNVIEQLAGATADGDRTLALFAQWQTEDATNDPAEIAARNHEWEALEASLKANRLSLRARRA